MPHSPNMLASMRSVLEDVLSGPLQAPDEAQIAHLVWADGLMTASIIGPSSLRLEEMLEVLCPRDKEDSEPAVRELLRVMQRARYEVLREEIDEEGPAFEPEHLDIADEAKAHARAAEWAAGFMRGVGMRINAWKVLFDDRAQREMFVPIIAFAKTNDGECVLQPAVTSSLPELHRECLPILGHSVFRIKGYWDERRADAKRHGGRLGKVGRNEPCPCGSCEKYKRCCLN